MPFLTVSDLQAFSPDVDAWKAQAMIADAEALAILVAPCLSDTTGFTVNKLAAVKAVLRGAILRWNEAGTGAVASQSVGPFSESFDNRQPRKGLFWPSEIAQLQSICTTGASTAFTIDTAPLGVLMHADYCLSYFGASPCTCGLVPYP